MFTVYVLRSLKNYRLYIGCTNNLTRRIIEHNTEQSKYTSLTKPFKIIYKEEYSTLLDARRRERFFKTGKGRELLKNTIG